MIPGDLPELPRDPYGRDYVLVPSGANLLYVFCLGADGRLERYPPDMATSITRSEAFLP
jgi:hypothetical protein